MSEDLLAALVPRRLRRWPAGVDRVAARGTLVSADISGFTALSERLAGMGRRGAEELTDLLNVVFGAMLDVVDRHGGDVLAFGGDAILVLFDGDEHERRAARACVDLQGVVDRPVRSATVGDVPLGMSVGGHAGTHHLLLVDATYRALVPVGPDVSAAVRAEGAAGRGDVLLSRDTAAALPLAWWATADEDGVRLDLDAVRAEPSAPTDRVTADLEGPADRVELPALVAPRLAAQVAAGEVHGEHRRVAIGFLSFGGTDATVAAGDVAAVARDLGVVAAKVAEACQVTGTALLATDVYPDGGKLILAAGAPTSTGDDAAALLRTLRHVLDHDPGLRLRAGANVGPVYLGPLGGAGRRTITVMGDAVNLAARLMQAAGPGELVASRAIADASRTPFALEPLPPMRVKGKEAEVHAVRVGARLRRADDAGAAQVDAGGRDRELAELLERVAVGRPSSAIGVVAEPGMGRARLLAALRASSPRRVLRVVADPFDDGVPYALADDLLRVVLDLADDASPRALGDALAVAVEQHDPRLRPWLPLLAVPLGAEVEPTPEADRIAPAFRARRIEDHVSRLVVLAAGPSLLVVEDLDRADEASRRVVAAVASRAVEDHAPGADQEREPVVVVSGNTLPDDLQGERLELGPMDDDLLRRLVVARVGDLSDRDLDRVVAQAGGSPLFALEVARSLQAGDEVPATVEELLTARLDQLGPAARGLVRDLSVLGTETTVAVAGAALDRAVDAEALAALDGVVRREGERLRFVHALHRDVAYAALSWRRRTAVHAAAADALVAAGAEPAVVSLHEQRGGLHLRAWSSSRTAAADAVARSAPAAATDLLERALAAADALHGEVPAVEVARVAEELGDVADLAARFDVAATAYARALDLVDEAVAHARLRRKRGTLRMRRGDYDAAEADGRAVVAALGGVDAATARGELARAHNLLAATAFRRGDYAASTVAAARGSAVAEAAGDAAALAHALWLGDHAAYLAGRPTDARPSEQALELLAAEGDVVGQANVLNNLGVRAYFDGRWTDAVALYERSRRARDAAGDVVGSATQRHNVAEVWADQGRYEDAATEFEEARRVWSAADFPLGAALAAGNLAWVRARLGDPDAEARCLAAADRLDELGAGAMATEVRMRAADLAARRGDVDAVVARVEGGDAVVAARMLALVEPDAGRRGELLAAAVAAAREGGSPHALGMALLAAAARHPDERVAADAFAEARAVLGPLDVEVDRTRFVDAG